MVRHIYRLVRHIHILLLLTTRHILRLRACNQPLDSTVQGQAMDMDIQALSPLLRLPGIICHPCQVILCSCSHVSSPTANTAPAMMSNSAPHAYSNQGAPPHTYQSQQPYDTTGQIAPPGMKPRVTATLWEDEGSLCFQVEAKGVCVARREGI